MLLLTDRIKEGRKLQQTLRQAQPCAIVPLHQALAHPLAQKLIICDVALDNVASIKLLHAALSHHRSQTEIPLLCLTRDPSQLTLSQARSTGAAAVLPYSTPPADFLEAVRGLVGSKTGAGKSEDDASGIRSSVGEAGLALGNLLGAAKRRQQISVVSLDRGSNLVLAAVGQAKIRAWLDVVWNYDDVTYQHCLIVAGLAAAFAIELGLTANQQRLVSQAALVHDIGKAHIPYEILNKPGQLTAAETSIMRNHPAIGYQMLAGQPGLHPQLLDVVRHHHEYLDGSGYPDRLRGGQVSRLVRLMTICDIYAALIERRPYKEPAPPEQAFSILGAMENKLDPGLLEAFRTVSRRV